MSEFTGVATVIGAGSGIGRATAILFVKRGCTRIAIGDVNASGLAETKKQMEAVNSSIEVLDATCDVTNEDSINTFVSDTVTKFGRIDYSCNVAGILLAGKTVEYSSSTFDKQWSVNTRGMWLCQKAQITQMLKQEPIEGPDGTFKARGAIANVASMAALRGYDVLPAYAASKHAILGFTKCDAYAYAPQLVRVNAVCPGVIATPMLGELDPNDPTAIQEMTKDMAMGRQGQPEEVAEGLVWLCSSRASFVTGIALPVNGGMIGA